jgi:hypothetical protein
LTYEGALPATQRGVSKIKSELRSHFHPQIKAQIADRLFDHERDRLTSVVGSYEFLSPVNSAYKTAVELDIFLLVPGHARSVGDSDNRLKTLIDGLTRPANGNQLRAHVRPPDGEATYCLMDDDGLVRRISFEVRRWWRPGTPADEALAIVTATIVLDPSADLTTPTGNLLLIM